MIQEEYYIELPKTAKKIENAIEHWVDIDGSIYSIDRRCHHKPKLIKKVQQTAHGYKYCGIKYDKGITSKRVHKLVAKAFIPNPNNLPVVGHKNNIKTDNRVENLYWTIISENTQKAVDDGLLKNDKGFDDSQNIPVKMFETKTNRLIKEFGSVSEAERYSGYPKGTILRQCRYNRPVRKEYYFRFLDDPSASSNELVGMFDYETDNLIETFLNSGDASRKTGYPDSTISKHLKDGKPKHKFKNEYFKYINNNKCEQTIENKYSE